MCSVITRLTRFSVHFGLHIRGFGGEGVHLGTQIHHPPKSGLEAVQQDPPEQGQKVVMMYVIQATSSICSQQFAKLEHLPQSARLESQEANLQQRQGEPYDEYTVILNMKMRIWRRMTSRINS